jgi:hypothetical protein
VAKFPLKDFSSFCTDLRVNTKEKGWVQLGKMFLGTQKRVLNEIQSGFDKGVHDFVVLKCRQIGMSTLTLAIDLYWLQRYSGTTGVLVTQDDGSREAFRTTLEQYYDGLPEGWQVSKVSHNRNQLVLENGSMMLYRVAGTKRSSGSGNLGRSSAPSLIHGTEVSSWADPEGIASLRNSMSETNPNRLYVWESTARGFNLWYRMWMASKSSVTQKAIFVSWHDNELYRTKRGTDMWNAYWGARGRMTEDERRRAREVKLLYGIDIEPEQVAWYRWYEAEKCSGNDLMAMQEMPWTENEAFVATGSRFFTAKAIGELYRLERTYDRPAYYRIQFYGDFRETQLLETNKSTSTMEVYEEPVKGAYYVMGADPAYGSSENADRFVVSVWRCYADRIVQAAEFVDADLSPHQFAWVMVYLAGAYDPCVYNLEINGPGQAVDNEITNLRKQVMFTADPNAQKLRNVLANMRTFLWKTPTGLMGGPTGRHTISTANVIERYMGEYKDYVERGMAEVKSLELINEMQNFERSDSGSLEAGAKGKDDRCIAAGLATMAWNDQIRTMLLQRGYTYDAVHGKGRTQTTDPTSRVLANMFIERGVIARPKQVIPGVSFGVPPSQRSSANRSRRGR